MNRASQQQKLTDAFSLKFARGLLDGRLRVCAQGAFVSSTQFGGTERTRQEEALLEGRSFWKILLFRLHRQKILDLKTGPTNGCTSVVGDGREMGLLTQVGVCAWS